MLTAILHRYPLEQIKQTNAAIDYLVAKSKADVFTFKSFDRASKWRKFFKSLVWIFYAPMLVLGRGYDVIYCDDSYPFYGILVKFVCPRSKVILRLGDLHLMYYTSGLVYKFLHFFELIGWNCADRIICISQPMADYVYSELKNFRWGIAQESDDPIVDVVLDPVDPKDFPINGVKSHGTVMFHGVLTKNKNVDILLAAAERLPQVNFVVIGDGPDRSRLEHIAPNNVFFKGRVPFKSMCHHIETCAVGVALRSNNPGNEYVVTSPFIQYGIMGKPCLVTKRKVFGDYHWQFSNVDELVTGIKLLLDKPEEGEKLRKYILENHDAQKIAGDIWSLLAS